MQHLGLQRVVLIAQSMGRRAALGFATRCLIEILSICFVISEPHCWPDVACRGSRAGTLQLFGHAMCVRFAAVRSSRPRSCPRNGRLLGEL